MESSEQLKTEAGTPEAHESQAADAAVERKGIQSLAELLAAEEAEDTNEDAPGGDEGEDTAESGGSKEKTKPTKFNDLAGAMGLDLDALYKLEVKLDDSDDPVTIEQLKDHYKGRSEFDLERIRFEEDRTQQEANLLRAKAELNEILQALPKNAVRPDVLEKIRTKTEQHTKAERAKTLEAIPEWQNQEKREADLAAMSEHLQQYGFPVDYLSTVVSHQHFKYIRDNMLRERRIREALAKVQNGKPGKAATPKPQAKAPRKGADLSKVQRGSHPDKLAAVFSTLDN